MRGAGIRPAATGRSKGDSMKKLIIIIIAIAAIVGAAYVLKGGPKTLGEPIPDGATITSIGEIASQGKAWSGKEVTVEGELTKKCPTTGCWFYMKDSTGEIRVDTAPSGFTITDIPTGKTVTVHGKVIIIESGDAELVATGVGY
jgi:uncharacterized protein YdeI (BOF family)